MTNILSRSLPGIFVLLLAIGFPPASANAASLPHKGETVILLHGILNRPVVMKRIEWTLKKEGYEVINWGYPSTERTIEEHIGDFHKFVQTLDQGKTIHIVGFSLGSIIARCYLSRYQPANVGRFVMIAPPNHGSEMADYLSDTWWYQLLYGDKAGAQLGTDNIRFFESCGSPPYEFGIIAGGLDIPQGLNPILPGDDDGTVSLQSTQLDGLKDFIIVNRPHTWLVWSQETSHHVISFLNSGHFDHQTQSSTSTNKIP